MTFLRILTRCRRDVEFLSRVPATALLVFCLTWNSASAADGGGFFEAKALMQAGKWPEAVILLRSVLEERPRFLAAQVELASALVRLERRGEAMTALNRWIASAQGNPREELISRVRSLSRIFMGEKNQQSYLDGLQLLNDGRKSEAKAKFFSILEKERENYDVLLRLGQTAVLEADYDSAVERLRTAVQLNPYEPTGHLWLGRALFVRGDVSAGLQELKIGQAGLPESEVATVWLAEGLSGSGDRTGALTMLERGLGSDPSRVLILVYLGKEKIEAFPFDPAQMQKAKKNLESAREMLKEAKQLGTRPGEGELSVRIFQAEDLQKEVSGLLQSVEDRLSRMGVK